MSEHDETEAFDFSSNVPDTGLLDAANDYVREVQGEAARLASGEAKDVTHLIAAVAGRSAVLIARLAAEMERLTREVETLKRDR